MVSVDLYQVRVTTGSASYLFSKWEFPTDDEDRKMAIIKMKTKSTERC